MAQPGARQSSPCSRSAPRCHATKLLRLKNLPPSRREKAVRGESIPGGLLMLVHSSSFDTQGDTSLLPLLPHAATGTGSKFVCLVEVCRAVCHR